MNTASRAGFVVMALWMAACGDTLTVAGERREIEDIAYLDEPATEYERDRCKLDLYLPARRQSIPFATIVWFHGGGLSGGDKQGGPTRAIARRFADAGIAVAAVNYRLSPKVRFPAYIDDAARSVAWVYRSISRHGGDPNQIFLSGHSAGGYLTAMLGLDRRFLKKHGVPSAAIAGLMPVSGQMITHSTVRKERGLPKTRPLIDAAAPSFHVSKDTPPMLCICGGNDLPARAEENIYFVAALKATGHKSVTYLEVAGRNHGTIANKIPNPDDPVAHAMLAFVKKHAK